MVYNYIGSVGKRKFQVFSLALVRKYSLQKIRCKYLDFHRYFHFKMHLFPFK